MELNIRAKHVIPMSVREMKYFRKKNLKNIRDYSREYCASSTIHGLQYLAERRSIFERIWWIVIFLGCVCASAMCIYATYKKWDQTPLIINFSNKLTPLNTIPFPAVTVCSGIKYSLKKINYPKLYEQIAEKTFNGTFKERQYFDYVSALCGTWSLYLDINLPWTNDFYRVLDDLIYSPHLEFIRCGFGFGFGKGCSNKRTGIITHEGVCVSYNILHRKDMFRESVKHYRYYQDILWENDFINHQFSKNVSSIWDSLIYPDPIWRSGIQNGLIIKLANLNDNSVHESCINSYYGYRIYIHSPLEPPHMMQDSFWLPFDTEMTVAINPSMVTISNSLQSYSLQKRKCYFESERSLKYFKIYTLSNCKYECLINITFNYCKCVAFYMPRTKESSVCGYDRNVCVLTVAKHFETDTIANASSRNCNCLPPCTELVYAIDNVQIDGRRDPLRSSSELNKNTSTAIIYFKSDSFIKLERNELYGPLDFLGNFGGILGLFTGFSLMSLMEIVYLLTIRLICNKRLYKSWWKHEHKLPTQDSDVKIKLNVGQNVLNSKGIWTI